MNILSTFTLTRRRFLQVSGAAGAAAGAGLAPLGLRTLAPAEAASAPGTADTNTIITKSVCHQCPARCGIDVYTTDGRVHAMYGTLDHPISNGKLCPKGPSRRLHSLRPRPLQGTDEAHQSEEGPQRGPEVRADLLGRGARYRRQAPHGVAREE